ncbi:MAG: mannose-6-phosphate isomerase, partial [Candidatus Aminicenantes bacterium]|nr:mannose-6-phosphate isomerase [Candidatus Aminicenantes bacterium]
MQMNYKEERPWGWFEILLEEEDVKVKRILVKEGKRLSLQSHKH